MLAVTALLVRTVKRCSAPAELLVYLPAGSEKSDVKQRLPVFIPSEFPAVLLGCFPGGFAWPE